MNKPLKYHGWRFCQSDYDSDGQGVVLSYNYDPWGIGITYTGYALLLLGMIAFFFQKNTYFRVLLKRQHTWLMVGLGIVAIILAFVMTKVVTPKPPLQPVLQTPLLGIHVSVIMLAYTLFAVIMLNGLIALINTAVRKINGKMVNDKMVNGLMQLSQLLLYPAVFCLAIGIFIGAVWANLSWGRYWGWDPKETWALITMIVYALLLHWPVLKGKLHLGNDLTSNKYQILYHIFSIIAFAFVLFTYFGVNRLLGGLHSYA
ncbi:MAG: cytochrome c biogenesis protein CcsA [Paludibacteraceae bacterium]|nr:cytochrome c biogenesis protein CcsA [Paludibacteraceae bacterium]MBQ7632336.1 cytochrome c biogenesis protein CcsA [Paludibacteraceae bacterium]